MDKTQVLDYIRSEQQKGTQKEDIYKALLLQGITVATIQDSYDELSEANAKEDTSKRTIKIILRIGALLIGAGIFSFIASNWQFMDRPLKVIVILVSMISVYLAGWLLQEKSQMTKTGEYLILLGTIIYGAGIFLVGQMFNIRANWPDGMILWLIGTLIMEICINLQSLLNFGLILSFVSIFCTPYYLYSDELPINSTSTSLILLIIATTLTLSIGLVMRKKSLQDYKEYY